MTNVAHLPTKAPALARLQKALELFASEDVAGIRMTRLFKSAVFHALGSNDPDSKYFHFPKTLYGHPYSVDPRIDIPTAFVIDLKNDREQRP
jgi:hypothetical protein